jgi:hypothetical protein
MWEKEDADDDREIDYNEAVFEEADDDSDDNEAPDDVIISQDFAHEFVFERDTRMGNENIFRSVTKYYPGFPSTSTAVQTLEDQCLLQLMRDDKRKEQLQPPLSLQMPPGIIRRHDILEQEAVDVHLMGVGFWKGVGLIEFVKAVKEMHGSDLLHVCYTFDGHLNNDWRKEEGGLRTFVYGREMLEKDLDFSVEARFDADDSSSDEEDCWCDMCENDHYRKEKLAQKPHRAARQERRFERVRKKLAREEGGEKEDGDDYITLYQNDVNSKIFICMKRSVLENKLSKCYENSSSDE